MFALNHLNGFNGRRISAAATKSLALITSGSASGTDSSIEIPGTIAAGDLCIIWNRASGFAVGFVTPSGFTVLTDITEGGSNTIGGMISAKILDGTETTVTGMNDTAESWICAVFRPVGGTLTGFAFNELGEQATTGDPTLQNIDASAETNLPILLVGQMGCLTDGTISPRTVDPAMDELTAANYHYAHYKIYNEGDTPTDHDYDMDDEGTNVLQSGYLDFTWA